MTEEKDFGVTGTEVFEALQKSLEISPENTALHMDFAIIQMQFIHARALACHCECLGMNAENCWAAMINQGPAYKSEHYHEVMQKWGISDSKGEPII